MSVIDLRSVRGGGAERPVITEPAQISDLLGIPFSDQQLDAITAPLEPGVIIAGAGSGKTTVMAARVVWLVATGAVRPEQVLGLTFTRKAAAELSQRVRAALDRAGVVSREGVDDSGEQLIMTYDAFAARIVADHGLRIGVEADPRMVTGATRYRLAAGVVARAAGPFEQLARLRPASITERVLRLDSELQAHLVGAAELDRHARTHRAELEAAPPTSRGTVAAEIRKATQSLAERLELAGLAAEYAETKRRLGVVEFADQMAVAARLAREVPAVSASLRAAYRVVLLDEYQDTSAAQAAMLQGLFSGADAPSGRGHPVTAVGDPFQAIYGWRGAAASNIVAFADDFPTAQGAAATAYALTVNRRSGRTILDVANSLAAPLRADARTPQTRDATLVAPDDAIEGEVHAATFETWPEEVAWIADRIVAYGPPLGSRSGGAPTGGRRGRDGSVRWADIAVLSRRNADIAQLYGALNDRDVPVEIVGLGGLLGLPEIADVTATLRLLDDVTANPDLIRLLTGPRWALGPRDLDLLGRRASRLARGEEQPTVTAVPVDHPDDDPDGRTTEGVEAVLRAAPGADDLGDPVLADLAEAVAEVDPTEMVCLLDAVTDPGPGAYSPDARERLGEFAAELAELRRHADEPVLDLIRRVITTLGLDVELAATPEFVRSGRGDQLAAFVEAVAAYVDVDTDASLSGMLAWLQAEAETGIGLERAVPSDAESVKLLTVHKAKGLEWEIVFLPALVDATFPSDRVTDNWVTNPAVVPSPLRGDAAAIPQLARPVTTRTLTAYKDALHADHRLSEDRLAYVAATRAKRVLIGTGHRWRPDTVKARSISDYLIAVLAEAGRQERVPHAMAATPAPVNPLITDTAPVAWPAPLDPDAWERRREAAGWVSAARAGADGRVTEMFAEELLLDDYAVVEGWDADLERLLDEARRSRTPITEVALPTVMSASAWLQATADPAGFAGRLVRPMPTRPSRFARFGTRFHRWVEQHFALTTLIGDDELTGSDAEAWDDPDLAGLCRAFAVGQFGERMPYRLEAPFEYRLSGRVIRGRIDAVYAAAADDGGGNRWLVVDWKTGERRHADELQLAIYRLAWAELAGVAPEAVTAGFYFVRTDELVMADGLPGPAELARRLARVWADEGGPSDSAPSDSTRVDSTPETTTG